MLVPRRNTGGGVARRSRGSMKPRGITWGGLTIMRWRFSGFDNSFPPQIFGAVQDLGLRAYLS